MRVKVISNLPDRLIGRTGVLVTSRYGTPMIVFDEPDEYFHTDTVYKNNVCYYMSPGDYVRDQPGTITKLLKKYGKV